MEVIVVSIVLLDLYRQDPSALRVEVSEPGKGTREPVRSGERQRARGPSRQINAGYSSTNAGICYIHRTSVGCFFTSWLALPPPPRLLNALSVRVHLSIRLCMCEHALVYGYFPYQ